MSMERTPQTHAAGVHHFITVLWCVVASSVVVGVFPAKTLAGIGIWTPSGPTGNVRSLAVDPAAAGTVYAGTYGGGVFKTTDGGANWRAVGDVLMGTAISTLAVD